MGYRARWGMGLDGAAAFCGRCELEAAEGKGSQAAPANTFGAVQEREAVFEFAEKPKVEKQGDKWVITFASKAACDAAVAILDKDGRVVRHLAAGVLGRNAPEPFQQDGLRQTLEWDGKSDLGRSVENPQALQVRVALGLNPTFDRVVLGHEKDVLCYTSCEGIAADKEGVYVLHQDMVVSQLRMYDHKGEYVRTLIPFRGDKLGDPQLNIKTEKLPSGRIVPARPLSHRFYIVCRSDGTNQATGMPPKLAAAGGWVVTLSDYAELLRMRPDGTTGGTSFPGPAIPIVGKRDKMPVFAIQARVALSPDGQWLYVVGLRPSAQGNFREGVARRDGVQPDAYDQAVWRVPRDAEGVLAELKPFVGQVEGGAPADPGKGLVRAQGIACDAQGRVYVCDVDTNRVQVYMPDGSHVKSIPVDRPREISIHQKTGEIYLLCDGKPKKEWVFGRRWQPYGTGHEERDHVVLRKFRSLEDPRLVLEQELVVERAAPTSYSPFIPTLCVDSWSEPTMVWVVHRKPLPRLYADRGNKLELVRDFVEDIRSAGLWPGLIANGFNVERVALDPARGMLYHTLFRLEPRPDAMAVVPFLYPDGWLFLPSEMGFSADGLLYIHGPSGGRGQGTRRIDPSKAEITENGFLKFPPGSVVPFAAITESPGQGLEKGVLPTEGGAPHHALWAVMPDGSVVGLSPRGSEGLWSVYCWDRDGNLVAKDLLTGHPIRELRGLQVDGRRRLFVAWQGAVCRVREGASLSPVNVLWRYPGFVNAVGAPGGCSCICGEFKTDAYGRSFVPKAKECTVGVVDANGNRICEIGRYGNFDTRGPDGPVKVGGDEIGLCWSWHLGIDLDRWLYLIDNGNIRVVRVKLGYVAEWVAPLP
ncbi:MAG: SMP-30/gluconolactonase/LRE family protein [Verrucomicrobiae bacterium]|nr:SMP-30/gluconolactonase/LRE family protein [Verrucomicrobiae bacterium]